MQRYHLHMEFVQPEVERQVIAAIARNPLLYGELKDSLSPDVFASEGEVWHQMMVANENSPKQASGYQREMHYDETPRFLKLFPL